MKAIKLFDDKDYIVVQEKIIDGITYTLFVNADNQNDLCFRKTIIENGEEYYTNLENEDEVKKVLLEFTK